jgi:hypothetical protein
MPSQPLVLIADDEKTMKKHRVNSMPGGFNLTMPLFWYTTEQRPWKRLSHCPVCLDS